MFQRVPLSRRAYSIASQPPRKSYYALKTPILRFWHRVPLGVKYTSGMLAGGYSVAHIHPDTLITVGPPVLLGCYYMYSRWRRTVASRNKSKVTSQCGTITIPKYDESLLEQVLAGVENEFDHFVVETVKLVESRIKEYLFEETVKNDLSKDEQMRLRFLLDQNEQLSVHLGRDLDLFVVSEDGDFIKLSIPMFSSSLVELRERVGTVEVFMVREESATKEDGTTYKCRLEVTPFKMFPLKTDRIVIERLPNDANVPE